MEDERDPNNLTPEERALIESGAEPDLPSGMPPLAALLQSTSLQLQPGNVGYVPGAVMGDFVVPRDGGLVLVKGATGITFVPVGFETTWPQARSAAVTPVSPTPQSRKTRCGSCQRRASTARDAKSQRRPTAKRAFI